MNLGGSSNDYRQVESLFQRAMDLSPEQRAAFLEHHCGPDGVLRRDVETLLRHHAAVPATYLSPAFDESGASFQPVEPPRRMGHYEIIRLIGQGGMGIVFEARQESPRRSVAVKLIRSRLASTESIRRFEYEAALLGRLQHPGIAHVYESGVSDVSEPGGRVERWPFLAMELIQGVSLQEFVRSRPDPRTRLELFIQICDAVEHAHQKGVIHRDLKPANILVTSAGQAKILDFGVARATDADAPLTTMHTQAAQVLGTIPYMSPEQVAGRVEGLDTRSDVYSLGVILYELLAGRLPYDLMDQTLVSAARVISEHQPIPLSSLNRAYRGDLETIVHKSLEKDAPRRYPSVHAFAADVRRYLNREPISARPASALYQMRRFAQRHTALVTGIVTAFLALVLGLSGTIYGLLRAQTALGSEARQRDKAERVAEFTQDVLGSASPFVSVGRDTRLLKDMLNAAVQRISGGELAAAPEAELRLRLTIGNTLREISAFDDAAAMLEPALDLARRTNAGDHPDTASALGYLGWLRLDTGNFPTALELFEESLEMRQRLYPGDHPDVASSIDRVASGLEKSGRYSDALTRFQEALAMDQRLYPGDHKEVADMLGNVAQSLHLNSRSADALAVQEKALAMYQRLYDGDHPLIAITLGNQAGCLRALGRSDEALPKYQESLAMRRRLSPDDDPGVANTINNVAACLRDMGRAAEALPLHEESLAMYRRLFPNDHPEVAKSLNSLGLCHFVLGNGQQALEHYQTAFEIRQRLFTTDHPDLAISLGNVGSALMVLRRYDEARAKHEAAVAMHRRLHEGDHINIAIALHNLADCIESSGNPEDALAPFDEALAMRQRLLPADHVEVLQGMLRLGKVLAKLGRYSDAEPLLVDGAERVLKRSYAPPKLKRIASDALQTLYEGWHAAEPAGGFDQKAAVWRARFAPPSPEPTKT
jgi:tetratricopeptide (TPR) repeat protein